MIYNYSLEKLKKGIEETVMYMKTKQDFKKAIELFAKEIL